MKIKIKRGIISVIVIAIVVIIAVLNSVLNYPAGGNGGGARIIISLNYGKEVIFDKTIPSGKSALDSLKSVANVTTSYSGGFVSGINGIMCDEKHKMDWFYYINGILANVGSSQYILRDGDVMRWDYHYWGNQMFILGEIEDFPEPLLHGYNAKVYPTIIAYEDEYKDVANIIYSYLKNEIKVEMKNIVNLSEEEKKKDNLVVIGVNSSLSKEINNMHYNLGFFYHIDNGLVEDINGTLYSGGFAEMTQSPFNPKGTDSCENVLIFISGNSHTGIKNCVEDLISKNINAFWCFEGEKI